jgi:hypothetical protein
MNHEYLQTYTMFASGSMMFFVTMVSFVVATLFGVQCNDRYWLPRPDQNLLSWGFGFLIISAIFCLAAGVFMFKAAWDVYDKLLEKEDEYTKMALDASMYVADHPKRASLLGPDEPEYGGRGTQSLTMVPLGYGRPQSYSHHSTFDHETTYPAPTVTSYSTQPSDDKQMTTTTAWTSSAAATAATLSYEWPSKQPLSTGFEPEEVASALDAHETNDALMQSHHTHPTLGHLGKSYDKSYERQYSDTSFDDGDFDAMMSKPERQY